MRYILELATLGRKLGNKKFVTIKIIVILIMIIITDRYNCSVTIEMDALRLVKDCDISR